MKTPLPAPACPNTDGTTYRILAFLASVQPISGGGESTDEAYHRGRSIIERMAISANGTDSPDIHLAPDHCADALQFLALIEPLEPENWWQDPAEGPSHIVGFQFVLQTLSANLRGETDRALQNIVREELSVTGVFTDGEAERTPIAGLLPAKRCPFCGTLGDIYITQVTADDDKLGPHYRAQCGNCGVDAPGGATAMDAASGWNTRGELYQVAEQAEGVS